MGSSLAVFQHFRNVEDVIAVFKMCILLRVAGGQILVKILNVYYRDLLHLILFLTWTVGHHSCCLAMYGLLV